jgi:hypothetical protein
LFLLGATHASEIIVFDTAVAEGSDLLGYDTLLLGSGPDVSEVCGVFVFRG